MSPPAGNTTRLRMEDIEGQRLFYEHDGSETINDTFRFLFRNLDAGIRKTGSGISGPIDFKISIELKNDNPPIQVLDKVRVARNREMDIPITLTNNQF